MRGDVEFENDLGQTFTIATFRLPGYPTLYTLDGKRNGKWAVSWDENGSRHHADLDVPQQVQVVTVRAAT